MSVRVEEAPEVLHLRASLKAKDDLLATARNAQAKLEAELKEVKQAVKEEVFAKNAELEKVAKLQESLRKEQERCKLLSVQKANSDSEAVLQKEKAKEQADENRRLLYELDCATGKSASGIIDLRNQNTALTRQVDALKQELRTSTDELEREREKGKLGFASMNHSNNDRKTAMDTNQKLVELENRVAALQSENDKLHLQAKQRGAPRASITPATNLPERSRFGYPANGSGPSRPPSRADQSSEDESKVGRRTSAISAAISAFENNSTGSAIPVPQSRRSSSISTPSYGSDMARKDRERLEATEKELSALKAKLANKERELLKVENAHMALIKSSESATEQLKTSLEDATDEIAHMRSTRDNELSQQKAEHDKHVRSLKEDKVSLCARIERLEGQLASSQKAVDAAEVARDDLDLKMARAMDEKEALDVRYKELAGKLAVAESNAQQLQASSVALDKAQAEAKDLREQLDAALETLVELENRVPKEEMDARVEEVEGKLKAKEEELLALQAASTQPATVDVDVEKVLAAERDQLARELSTLKEQHSSLEEQHATHISSTKARLEAARVEKEAGESQLAAVKHDVDAATTAATSLNGQIATLQAAIEASTAQVALLTTQLEEARALQSTEGSRSAELSIQVATHLQSIASLEKQLSALRLEQQASTECVTLLEIAHAQSLESATADRMAFALNLAAADDEASALRCALVEQQLASEARESSETEWTVLLSHVLTSQTATATLHRDELDTLQSDLLASQSHIDELEEKVKAAEMESWAANEGRKDMGLQVPVLKEALAAARERIDEMTGRELSATGDIEALKASLAQTESSAAVLDDLNKDLRGQCAALEKDLAVATATLAEVTEAAGADKIMHSQSADDWKASDAALSAELDAARTEYAALHLELDRHLDEHIKLRAELADTAHEVELLASSSTNQVRDAVTALAAVVIAQKVMERDSKARAARLHAAVEKKLAEDESLSRDLVAATVMTESRGTATETEPEIPDERIASLERQVVELQSRVVRRTEQIATLEASLAAMSNRIKLESDDDDTVEIVDTTANLERLAQELKETRSHVDTLSEELIQAREAATAAQGEAAAEKAVAAELLASLSAAKAELVEGLATAEAKLETERTALAQLEAVHADATQRIRQELATLAASTNEESRLREELARSLVVLGEEKADALARLDEGAAERQELREALNMRDGELAASRQKVEEVERALVNLRHQLKSGDHGSNSKQVEAELQSTIEMLDRELESRLDKIESMQHEMDERDGVHAALEAEHGELLRELHALEAAAQADVAAAEERLADALARCDELEEQNVRLGKEQERMAEEIEEHDDRQLEAVKTQKKLQNNLQKLQVKCENLTRALRELTAAQEASEAAAVSVPSPNSSKKRARDEPQRAAEPAARPLMAPTHQPLTARPAPSSAPATTEPSALAAAPVPASKPAVRQPLSSRTNSAPAPAVTVPLLQKTGTTASKPLSGADRANALRLRLEAMKAASQRPVA